MSRGWFPTVVIIRLSQPPAWDWLAGLGWTWQYDLSAHITSIVFWRFPGVSFTFQLSSKIFQEVSGVCWSLNKFPGVSWEYLEVSWSLNNFLGVSCFSGYLKVYWSLLGSQLIYQLYVSIPRLILRIAKTSLHWCCVLDFEACTLIPSTSVPSYIILM